MNAGVFHPSVLYRRHWDTLALGQSDPVPKSGLVPKWSRNTLVLGHNDPGTQFGLRHSDYTWGSKVWVAITITNNGYCD